MFVYGDYIGCVLDFIHLSAMGVAEIAEVKLIIRGEPDYKGVRILLAM